MELQELYSVAVPQRYWDVCLQLADAAGQGNRLEPRDLQELWKLYLLQVGSVGPMILMWKWRGVDAGARVVHA